MTCGATAKTPDGETVKCAVDQPHFNHRTADERWWWQDNDEPYLVEHPGPMVVVPRFKKCGETP